MIWLAYLSAYISVIPFVYGLLKFKFAEKQFKWAIGYFILVFITEVITSTLSLYDRNNASVANIFYLLEGTILCIFMMHLLNITIFKIIIALISYAIIWSYFTLYANNFEVYNSDIRTVESIFLLILSGITLLQLTKKSPLPIFENYNILTIFGIFIYFGINLVLFYSTKILIALNNEHVSDLWVIHSVSNIFTVSLFIYSLYLLRNKSNNEWRY